MSEVRRKTGQFHKDELAFIQNNVNALTAEQMAERLGRTVEVIQKHIARLPKRAELAQQLDEIEQLHASPLWVMVKRELMTDERAHFESEWVRLIRQFGSGTDILATDEISIKDLIILDIYGSRAAAEIVNAKTQMEALQKQLDKEREKDPAVRDMVSLQNWQEQLNSLRASLKPLTESHLQYQQRKDAKMDDLKATRKARFKEAEESRTSFFPLLQELNEYKNRLREGRIAQKVLLAAQKVAADWNEVTTYEDESVDKPFLSPEGELADEQLKNQGDDNE